MYKTGWFFPSSNPTLRINGIYSAPQNLGDSGWFKITLEEELAKLPKFVMEGFVMPNTPGATVKKGLLVPSSSLNIPSEFKPLPKSSGGQGNQIFRV